MNPKDGKAGTAVDPAEPAEALEAVTADPGTVESATAAPGEKATNAGTAEKVPPLKKPEKGEERISWIEIELLDEAGSPVVGERYEVVTPNGLASGRLDEKGFARIDQIDKGSCEITFPELDKEAWEKKAGGGAAASDEKPEGRDAAEEEQREEGTEEVKVPKGGSDEPNPGSSGGEGGNAPEEPKDKKEEPIEITGKEKTSEDAVAVLEEILRSAGLKKAKITSGVRTAHDQARVMYDNIKSHGVEHQKELYGKAGDKVIDVYVENSGRPKDEVVELMEKKIQELGPSKVSKHCSDDTDVFDVAPSSITDKPAFEQAIKDAKEKGWINHYILPPGDPAYHIEIKKQ